jgi:polar amino acid transport system substrate-binding protein
MPMTLMEHGELTGGIQRDLGLALARQLGTTARFAPMPRKRIGVVLEQGQGDLSCHYLPAWLPGAVDWSVPFLPNAIQIVTLLQHPAPARIEQLRGVPLGTVLGFAYPELEQALGTGFVRDEASDSLQNLVKFAAGRTRHAVTGAVFFNYQQRLHPGLLQTHRPLVVARIEARCAVSRRGRFAVARVDQAIRALQQSGRIDAIYAAYR